MPAGRFRPLELAPGICWAGVRKWRAVRACEKSEDKAVLFAGAVRR